MPVADCGAFEVGERSEVGVLESYLSRGRLWGLRSNPPLSEDARRQTWAFEVGERSEVGVLESFQRTKLDNLVLLEPY